MSKGCILNWVSDENTYSSQFSFATFIGWYIKVEDEITEYFISDYSIDGSFVEISDSNGPITSELLGIDFCNFCLVKKEKRIVIPEDYIDKISIGDKVKINSNCLEGEFIVSEIVNENSIGSINIINTPENSDICLIIRGVEIGLIEIKMDKSEVVYNGKHYYYKNDFGYDFYIIWSITNSRWEIYIDVTSFDVINGPQGGQLFSYFIEDTEYPVASVENWIKETDFTVTAETKFCNVEIVCNYDDNNLCCPIIRICIDKSQCFQVKMEYDEETGKYVGQFCFDELCGDFFIEFLDETWQTYVVSEGITYSLSTLSNGVENDCPIEGEEGEIGELTWRLNDAFYTSFGPEATFTTLRGECGSCCNGTICHTGIVQFNNLEWNIIEKWQMDKLYATGSIVLFDDILYVSTYETITELPIIINNNKKVKATPYNSSDWSIYNNIDNIFWNPTTQYVTYSLVYNNGDYYNCINMSGSDDFWNPTRVSISATGYGLGEKVLFKGEYYISLTSSNIYPPDYKRPEVTRVNNLVSRTSATYQNYWELTQPTSPKWEPVPLWSENSMYMNDQLVVFNNIVFGFTGSNSTPDDVPGVSNKWIRKWSLIPDTNYVYQPTSNPIIEMNGEYYMISQNGNNSTLNNGIKIYINKKWKNVFVNINISDNTLPNISESDRDDLYKIIYKKLSAFNFIQSVNDISNKYDFTDYLTYVIIDEDGTISEYNLENNLTNLPNIIFCEDPDEFGVKIDSLKKSTISKPEKLKSYKSLIGGRISNISELNYYNNSSIGYTIEPNQNEVKVFENYHGNKNFKEDVVYRFSGTYMPIFYDIELFEKGFNRDEIGNYKFDSELTYFGLIKERKFRKVNRKSSILKLADVSDFKSIYPMLDEFGLTYNDEFIFKSTWDLNYHIESYKPNSETVIVEEPIITTNDSNNYGQPQIIQSQNNNQLL